MSEQNATLLLGAIVEMSDRCKAAGGTTCIAGIAAAHAMQTSIQKNRPRIVAMLDKMRAGLTEPTA